MKELKQSLFCRYKMKKSFKRAGVFDSGAGGLTVVKSLIRHKLFDEIIYYGDTARVPYGSKDSATIIRYALEALEFFKNFDIDLMITACNSVSAYALLEIKDRAKFDVYGVIEPGILALKNANLPLSSKILILGTKATIKSGLYQRGIFELGFRDIKAIATPLFVPIVEEGIFSGEVLQSTLNYYLKSIAQPDVVILGCTHFPLISKAIGDFFSNKPLLIHSGEAIAEYLEQNGYSKCSKDSSELKIFASENPDGLKSIAKKWIY